MYTFLMDYHQMYLFILLAWIFDGLVVNRIQPGVTIADVPWNTFFINNQNYKYLLFENILSMYELVADP